MNSDSRLFGGEVMNWNTIYISGNGDFREEVRRKLEYYLPEGTIMPGFLGALPAEGTHDLYWIDANIPVRQIKEAIGARLIWKHRLHFCTTQEEFQSAHQITEELSSQERQLMEEMQRRGAA